MELPTQIFLDGGDPVETKNADALLKRAGLPGVQGQTTNPSLIAKNYAGKLGGKKVTETELLAEYKRVAVAMAEVTQGPISIQVTGDSSLTVDQMLLQARERKTWIPNSVIKFPCTKNGLKAASVFCEEWTVNITLNFSQEQAAGVYAATENARFPVFISPFVGRLDDRGEFGMDVVNNILAMYRKSGERHIQVLTASVRSLDHLLYAIALGSDAVTVPYKILAAWEQAQFRLPEKNFVPDKKQLKPIPYRDIPLDKPWDTYDLSHPLTDVGIAAFWADWKALIS